MALLAVEMLETTSDNKVNGRFPGIEGPLKRGIDDRRARVTARQEMKLRKPSEQTSQILIFENMTPIKSCKGFFSELWILRVK